MSWTSMHFAVGMGCTGAAFGAGCLYLRRGFRWLPTAMTIGGFWALVPDSPRLFREDFPQLGLASSLGAKSFEHFLHGWGDLFWFHHQLDLQPHEYALHGLAAIILFYNLSIAMLMVMERRQRNSLGNRAWRAHGPTLGRLRRRRAHVDELADDEAPPMPTAVNAPFPRLRSSHLSKL